MGDFNIEWTGQTMKISSYSKSSEISLGIKPAVRTQKNPNCIDLMIMKIMPKSFQNSQKIETGLSNFGKMCLTVLKVFYTKHIVQYTKVR